MLPAPRPAGFGHRVPPESGSNELTQERLLALPISAWAGGRGSLEFLDASSPSPRCHRLIWGRFMLLVIFQSSGLSTFQQSCINLPCPCQDNAGQKGNASCHPVFLKGMRTGLSFAIWRKLSTLRGMGHAGGGGSRTLREVSREEPASLPGNNSP